MFSDLDIERSNKMKEDAYKKIMTMSLIELRVLLVLVSGGVDLKYAMFLISDIKDQSSRRFVKE